MILETERLILRSWREADLEPFAEINRDPIVMEHMLGPLTLMESQAWMERMQTHWDERGFGPWAVELKENHAFIGYIGLSIPAYELPFSPCVEIAWRLSAVYWRRGLATEGAKEVLRYGFETLRLPEVVSFTVPVNVRSQRVMEKIGMVRDLEGDFDHPRVPKGHPLLRHVLYRLRNPAVSLAERV